MPRKKREREETLPHHVMCRSIQELMLFRDDFDKEKYLRLMKEAVIEFQFDIIAYCLMDTHLHILLHPKGADISKIMRKINNSYAKYYNKRYHRRGHLFSDRFKSKPIYDEHYFLRVSTYIHNNPKDLVADSNNISNYKYSSLGIYLDIRNDKYHLVATGSLLKYLGDSYKKQVLAYERLMEIQRLGKDDFEKRIVYDLNNNMEYRNEKCYIKRDLTADQVLEAVAKVLNITDINLFRVKYSNKYIAYKSIAIIAMRALCNVTRKEVAHLLGNISLSNVTTLSKKGIQLLDSTYSGIFSKIIEAI